MADETEDPLDERLESIQRRAENFRELLKDGEEVTIACQDGEVVVEESYRSKFERKHAKLYGRMLSIEAQMGTGLVPYFIGLIAAGVFIFGLQLPWWDWFLDEDVRGLLNRWWFYIALPIVVIFVIHRGVRRWERRVYRRNRQELLDLIAAERLDRDVLLVMLRDVEEVEGVVGELSLDPGPFPKPRSSDHRIQEL